MGSRQIPGILQRQFFLGFLIVIMGIAHAGISTAQEAVGPCDPGLVQHNPGFQIVPGAFAQAAETSPGAVLLEWLGHSSFLLTSPGATRILMDPSSWHPTPVAPQAVTISNLHPTHSIVDGIPGEPRLLWGVKPSQEWNRIAVTIQDVTIFNVPSYANRSETEQGPVQNSIFVFRTGGLCIVHLGNLRHPLTPEQLRRIGRPDVALVPVEGFLNLSPDEILLVIRQLQPLLVVPMHIETPQQASIFTAYASQHYPVRRIAGRLLTLSRGLLPQRTEIVQFEDS